MKQCYVGFALLLFLVSFKPVDVLAVDAMPDGLAVYYTDLHGAESVFEFFDNMLKVADDQPYDPKSSEWIFPISYYPRGAEPKKAYMKYDEYLKGLIEWQINIAEKVEEGYRWDWCLGAPKGHRSYKNYHKYGANPPKLDVFLCAYRRYGDPRYLDIAKAVANQLVNSIATIETAFGTGTWTRGEARSADPKKRSGVRDVRIPLMTAIFLTQLADVTGEAKLKQYLPQTLVTMRSIVSTESVKIDDESCVTYSWSHRTGQSFYPSGSCMGNAGVVWTLIEAREFIPDFTFSDGVTLDDFIKGCLDWQISQTKEKKKSYTWLDLDPRFRNKIEIGYGHGSAGITAQLLQGYLMYKDSDKKAAARYLKYGKGAADFIAKSVRSQDTADNCGRCGGLGSIFIPFVMLAEILMEQDREASEEYTRLAEKVGDILINSSVKQNVGIAWRAARKFGTHNANMAFDYGVPSTGDALLHLASALYQLEELRVEIFNEIPAGEPSYERFFKAAEDTADWIVSKVEKDGNGYKWRTYIPLDILDKDPKPKP